MAASQPRSQVAGIALVEVLIAMLVLIVGLVSTAQLLAVSTVALADARVVTAATLEAEDVLDELAAAGFAAPALQIPQGDGIAADTLAADVDGYVDHSAAGRTRRWRIDEGPVAGTRVVSVRVLSRGARRYGGHIELLSMVRRR